VTRDDQKRAAAARAVALVESGMAVGLGSGTTASFAIEALAARRLDIACIPTSERSAALARRLGLRLVTFAEQRRLDLDIDGADLVERGTLTLVKGAGGALLREKIVARASRRLIVVVDQEKLVDRFAARTIVPVELVPFGAETTLDRLAGLGLAPRLRQGFVTDGGNLVADCVCPAIDDAAAVEARLKSVLGVVESGLFVGLAAQVFVGGPAGVEVIGTW
jgi:ribose 5-phosphate isomerase A